MSYTLIWKHTAADQAGKILIGHPGTFSEDAASAKEEGRRILADDQIDHADRDALTPLAVVEVDEEMGDDIQENCEEVEIGTELLFYDLAQYSHWQSQPWWPAS